jgi:hypothetical protein
VAWKAQSWYYPNHEIGKEFVMSKTILFALIFGAAQPLTGSAFALTAEVAKKCEALTAKAYPHRVPGNPAAGSSKGSWAEQREYFNKCVANEGNVK